MLEHCDKHPHEKGAALCRRCGHAWCTTCLVYAFGPKKPPYCMSCAMVAGGVKSSSGLPPMPKRQLKAQMRAMKAATKSEAKAEAKSAKAAKDGKAPKDEPAAPEAQGPEAQEPAVEAAGGSTDWATPWWEDREPTALAD